MHCSLRRIPVSGVIAKLVHRACALVFAHNRFLPFIEGPLAPCALAKHIHALPELSRHLRHPHNDTLTIMQGVIFCNTRRN